MRNPPERCPAVGALAVALRGEGGSDGMDLNAGLGQRSRGTLEGRALTPISSNVTNGPGSNNYIGRVGTHTHSPNAARKVSNNALRAHKFAALRGAHTNMGHWVHHH